MRFAFAVCGLLALVAVWLPHYPVGTDLPQHANLFRLWADLGNGPFEYRATYRVVLFTPYLLPYALALPFTKLFGALVATKCLLTFMVCATPFFMSRWLRTIGADPAFGLLGFVVAFDYSYLWGFVSCAVAIPLMFAYLSAFEAQRDRPSWGRVVRTSAWATALFFSHGITFGVSVLIAMFSWFLRGRWIARYRAALHVVPLIALTSLWLTTGKKGYGHPTDDWFGWPRAMNLFSGAFMPYPDQDWAFVAAAGVAIFLLLARPRLALGPTRVAPLAIALLGFVALPDWLASTWLVGSRLCVFVHGFAPAILAPRVNDRVARAWPAVLFALVAAFLVLLNLRLQSFNRELAGFRELAALIPAGANVETLVPHTNNSSREFGGGELGQVPAWITAEQGGLIANDSARAGYFQIPVQLREDPLLPQYYPYVIAHGGWARQRATLNALTASEQGPARLVKQAGSWLLLQRPALETEEFSVIGYGQGWGTLRIDRGVTGVPLTIARVPYPHGLGTHARSLIRIRLKRPAQRFVGACGVDDSAGPEGHATFRIRDSQGRSVFESGAMLANTPAKQFAISLEGARELILEVASDGGINYAHADWVNLALR